MKNEKFFSEKETKIKIENNNNNKNPKEKFPETGGEAQDE
jgi:hypothetical protein